MEDISLARLLERVIFFMILHVKFIIIDGIATWFDSSQVFRVLILPIDNLFAFLKLVILYAFTKLVWFFITATIKQLFIRMAATRWMLTFTVYFWKVGPIDHFLLLIELQSPGHPFISNTCGLHRLHIVITFWLILSCKWHVQVEHTTSTPVILLSFMTGAFWWVTLTTEDVHWLDFPSHARLLLFRILNRGLIWCFCAVACHVDCQACADPPFLIRLVDETLQVIWTRQWHLIALNRWLLIWIIASWSGQFGGDN